MKLLNWLNGTKILNLASQGRDYGKATIFLVTGESIRQIGSGEQEENSFLTTNEKRRKKKLVIDCKFEFCTFFSGVTQRLAKLI